MSNIFIQSDLTKTKNSKGSRAQKPTLQATPPNESSSTPRRVIYLVFGSGILMVLIAWVLFFSPWFKVSEIKVEGEISEETRKIVEQLYGKNIFLLGNRSTETRLILGEPRLKKIHVIRGLPNFINVQVIERLGIASWYSNGNWYLLDEEGVAFRVSSEGKYIKIIDDANIPVELGKKIVAKDLLHFLQAIERSLPSVVDMSYVEGHIEETTFSLRVKTSAGVDILFNATRPLAQQLNALKKVLGQKKENIRQYVDVRVEGYVFYQ
jgi:cell division septal protein FtsQ